MSEFLESWDRAIARAVELHQAGVDIECMEVRDNERGGVIAARTMHPSFITPPVPKYDPERDRSN